MVLNKKNEISCYLFRVSNYIGLISGISLLIILSFYSTNNNNIATIFGQQSNAQFDNGNVNIVAVGDFYCNDETEDTIENIISVNPELITTTGDHVKDEESASCWIEMSQPIKDKMKIAIGNHDRDSSKIYKQITR